MLQSLNVVRSHFELSLKPNNREIGFLFPMVYSLCMDFKALRFLWSRLLVCVQSDPERGELCLYHGLVEEFMTRFELVGR